MLRGMTTRQFLEWRDYADLEPFDETRADLRTASIVQALCNLFGRKKGQQPFPLKEFVLEFGKAVEAKPKDRAQAMAQVATTMNVLMQIYNQKGVEKPRAPRLRG